MIGILFAVLAQAPQAAPTPLRIAASSQATVEVHLNARRIGNRWYEEDASLSGPSRIAISYGQPHARGRKVEGDLKLSRGDYSLYILYARTGYALIVNRGTGQWGTDHDGTKDIGRVALASRAM